MRKYLRIMAAAALTLAMASCHSYKEIVYFQDVEPGLTEYQPAYRPNIRLRPNDQIQIVVNTPDAELSQMFNLPYISQQLGSGGNSGRNSLKTGSGSLNSGTNGSRGYLGYTVYSDGTIHFPVLGNLRVEGMTREQVANYITNELITRELVKEPTVTVEYMNLNVRVLGEAGTGAYAIDRDDYNILDLVSRAGDLTINGLRHNIKVMRDEDGVTRTYSLDLTDAKSLYASPAFYLQQNDLVYVEPNKTKIRTSTANGNTFRTPSFWTGMISFFISMVTLFVSLAS